MITSTTIVHWDSPELTLKYCCGPDFQWLINPEAARVIWYSQDKIHELMGLRFILPTWLNQVNQN